MSRPIVGARPDFDSFFAPSPEFLMLARPNPTLGPIENYAFA